MVWGPIIESLLLSGGIDSIALAFWRRPAIAVTIDYGQQPAASEIQAASAVCRALELDHLVVRADCSSIGSGDLAGSPPLLLAPMSEWWPFRNQLLVTLAGAALALHPPGVLLLGTVASDSMHADGTPAFVAALSTLMSCQEGAMTVEAPAISMSSEELVRASGVPRHVLAWAHSCHTSNYACGRCRGCIKHYNVMSALGFGSY